MADKIIIVRLEAQTGQYQAELAAATRSTVGAAQQMGGAATTAATRVSSFGRAASTFGKIATIGVAGGLALSAKAAIDFESSFAGIQKTVDATPAQFAAISDAIRELSTQIPVTADELARIGEIGGQLGIDASGIVNFTEVIARLGASTELASDDAAKSIAQLSEILGTPASEFENIASALVGLGNNFETTESSILNFALRIAPVGRLVGLTADEVLALATTFSSLGIPAERGGTAVQKAFTQIKIAVDTGSEALETIARTAGVTIDEFTTLFRTDASEAFQIFIEGLGTVEERGGNVFEVLQDLRLANERSVQALLAVASAQGKLNDANDSASTFYEQNIELLEESEKRFGTQESQIRIAINTIRDLGIEIGNTTLPIIGQLSQDLITLVDIIREGDTPIGQLLGTVLGLAAGFKILTFLGGRVIPIVQGIGIAMAGANASGGRFVGLLGSLKSLLAGGIFTLALVGVGKFIESQIDARQRVEELVEALMAEQEGLKGVAREAIRVDLVENIDQFNLLGISIEETIDALLGNDLALGRINNRLDTTLGAINTQRNSLGEYELGLVGVGDATERWQDTLDATQPELEAVLFIQDLLARKSDEVAQAQERVNENMEAARSQSLIDHYRTQGSVMDEIALVQRRVNTESGKYPGILDDMEGALGELGEEIVTTVELLENFFELIDEPADAAEAFVGLMLEMTEAQREVRGESGLTAEGALELRNIFDDLQETAAEVGPRGLQLLINDFIQMEERGIITKDELAEIIATIEEMAPAAADFASRSSDVIQNLDLIRQMAEEAGIPVGDLLDLLGVSGQVFSEYTESMAPVIAALQAVSAAFGIIAGILPGLDSGFGSLFSAVAGGLGSVSGALSGAAGGLGGGGGSTGGGGPSSPPVLDPTLPDFFPATTSPISGAGFAPQSTANVDLSGSTFNGTTAGDVANGVQAALIESGVAELVTFEGLLR